MAELEALYAEEILQDTTEAITARWYEVWYSQFEDHRQLVHHK